MTQARSGVLRRERRNSAASGVADWLYLAAAPTFAVMALLTGVAGSSDVLCSSASPLSGMVPMYILMSAFHLAPWLKLMSRLGSSRPTLPKFDKMPPAASS